MRYILGLCAVLILSGCSLDDAAARVKPPAPAPVLPDVEAPKPGKDGKVDPLEQAKYDFVVWSERAAQAEQRYEKMRQIAYDDAVQNQVTWITGIALLIGALAIIGAVVSPVGKKTFVGVVVACGIIAACAQAFRESIPYLPWIGGGLMVVAGTWVAFSWKKLATTVRTASDHGDRLEDWLVHDLAPRLDDENRQILLATIAEAKEESKRQAMLLGTHKDLQYIRGKADSLGKRVLNIFKPSAS